VESQNHGMFWVGREKVFRGPTPPAVSRDIFNQTRLLRALSYLTLNISKDGATPPLHLWATSSSVSPPSFLYSV